MKLTDKVTGLDVDIGFDSVKGSYVGDYISFYKRMNNDLNTFYSFIYLFSLFMFRKISNSRGPCADSKAVSFCTKSL